MACETRWTAGAHPTAEELLLAREDQLPLSEAKPIAAHIQQCWQCRAHAERYRRGVEVYLAFRQTQFDPVVTPLAGAWLRLAARLREEGTLPRSPEHLYGRGDAAEAGLRRIWLAVPALAAVILVGMLVFSPAPLTANTVLDRAMRAEAEPQASLGYVKVRRKGQPVAPDERTLRAAYIDPAQPLSARTFRTWHDGLRAPHDSVIQADGEIRLETTTVEGTVALARLTLASGTYAALRKRVELRSGDIIDVDTARPPAVAVPPIAPPVRDETLELEVRQALRRIDADLGEPLRIQTSGTNVVVSGTLDDVARRDLIAETLAGLSHVSVQLKVASADAGLLAEARPVTSGGASASPLLAARLAIDFPDAGKRSAFVTQALHLSRDILLHSWALRRLAERYPPAVAAALPADAEASLEGLIAAHQNAVRAAAREASGLWAPYVQFDAGGDRPRTNWQAGAAAALRHAQSFDHLSARLLAAGGADKLDAMEALKQLRAAWKGLQ